MAVQVGDVEDDDFEGIECEEKEGGEEAREASCPQRSQIIHSSGSGTFRSWCPHCVISKAKDLRHKIVRIKTKRPFQKSCSTTVQGEE